MTQITKFAAAIGSTAVMLAAVALPALANTTTVNVVGNGSFSNTGVSVSNNSTSTTSQTNNVTNINTVTQQGNTGGNNVSFNTGGGNSIATGAVNQDSTVTNGAGSNTALGGQCGCLGSTTGVVVSGNGDSALTGITVMNSHNKTLTQLNLLLNVNYVTQRGRTGKNTNSFNTGIGTNSVGTGGVSQTSYLTNNSSSNTALP